MKYLGGFAIAIVLIACGLLVALHIYTTGKVIAQHPARVAIPSAERATMNVLFMASRDSHGEGEHEHKAGVLLLESALRDRYPNVATTVVYGGWPEDATVLENIDALVMYCDGGPFHPINRNLEAFKALLEARVGVAALHYCVEAAKESESSRALLDAIGGYFETHWSVNPHWTDEYETLPKHPVTARAKPFSLLDEWYFNMRFITPDEPVTPLLRAIPPASTMGRSDGPHSGNPHVREQVAAGLLQTTAWVYERPDGGRGFGYTGGHFHANWQNDNTRNIVVDAIRWVAEGR